MIGTQGVLGICGERLFIFSEHWYLFWGAGEQARSFGDLGSPAKKEKPPFSLIKKYSGEGGEGGGSSPDPLVNSYCFFVLRCTPTAALRGHVKKIFISFPRHKVSFPRHNYLVPTT